ncbi:MAG: rhodanese-like domain-containing protein, partial [Chloroflexota bacterium]
LIEDPEMIVIDVRTADELAENGVIDTADVALVNIPLEEFIAQMTNWPADKAAHIVVYCGSGHRSTMAMTMLWSYGYTNVSSLKGGFGGWVEAGYPVVEYVAP